MTPVRQKETWRPFQPGVCFSLTNRSSAVDDFIHTPRDGWPGPRHLLPFGAMTAIEQRITFVAPAQTKAGLVSKGVSSYPKI